MTKRNPDIKGYPLTVSFVADTETINEFKGLVGDQNFSREIRAMIADRVAQEKNEKAYGELIDPLGLSNLTQKDNALRGDHTRQSTLFEVFAVRDRRDEIVRFVKAVSDVQTLNQLEQNCKCMLKTSETHRQKIRVYA